MHLLVKVAHLLFKHAISKLFKTQAIQFQQLCRYIRVFAGPKFQNQIFLICRPIIIFAIRWLSLMTTNYSEAKNLVKTPFLLYESSHSGILTLCILMDSSFWFDAINKG